MSTFLPGFESEIYAKPLSFSDVADLILNFLPFAIGISEFFIFNVDSRIKTV
ncbi:MAG: hypothetical protein HUJ51_01935 [Eggerthellaceae bacterium]|nr:hypothetical protein [Eggerthellaceae bacterium]